jgi:hypothetical protein
MNARLEGIVDTLRRGVSPELEADLVGVLSTGERCLSPWRPGASTCCRSPTATLSRPGTGWTLTGSVPCAATMTGPSPGPARPGWRSPSTCTACGSPSMPLGFPPAPCRARTASPSACSASSRSATDCGCSWKVAGRRAVGLLIDRLHRIETTARKRRAWP